MRSPAVGGATIAVAISVTSSVLGAMIVTGIVSVTVVTIAVTLVTMVINTWDAIVTGGACASSDVLGHTVHVALTVSIGYKGGVHTSEMWPVES